MGLLGDVQGKRILDLACRTGLFTVALAKAGADVVAIEGRQENLDLAPRVDGVQYILGDVRALPDLGQFDAVLCLGILYHLGAADAVALLGNLRTLTSQVIVDTHVGEEDESILLDHREYHGRTYLEPPGLWSSLDLTSSWWFSLNSLNDAFCATGWTCTPVEGVAYTGEPVNRRWFVLEAS